jgi:hypothetical protein
MNQWREQMKVRTHAFSVDVILLLQTIPDRTDTRRVKDQLAGCAANRKSCERSSPRPREPRSRTKKLRNAGRGGAGLNDGAILSTFNLPAFVIPPFHLPTLNSCLPALLPSCLPCLPAPVRICSHHHAAVIIPACASRENS